MRVRVRLSNHALGERGMQREEQLEGGQEEGERRRGDGGEARRAHLARVRVRVRVRVAGLQG